MYLRSYTANIWDKYALIVTTTGLGLLLAAGIVADVVSAKILKSGYTAPNTPTNFTASNETYFDKIRLQWISDLSTTYVEIWRASSANGPFSPTYTVNSPATSFDDTQVTCTGTWFYRLRAGNPYAVSGYTSIVQGKTATCSIAVASCDQVTQFLSSDFSEVGTNVGQGDKYDYSQFSCLADIPQGASPETVYGVKTPTACYVEISADSITPYVLVDGCGPSATCLNTKSWNVGGTRMTGFEAQPNTSYYVIAESFYLNGSPYTIGFRFFGCGEARPACSSGAEWAQLPAAYGTPNVAGASASLDEGYDIFNVPNPIQHLRWWGAGYDALVDDCSATVSNFDIELHNAGFGAPSGVNAVYTVDATPVATSMEYYGNPIYQYDVDFNTPLPLTVGWLHIRPNNAAQGCNWKWIGSDEGNAFAIGNLNTPTYLNRSLAFCLSSALSQHTADQTGDNIISLSELLRIIQFYNSGGLHCEAGTEDGFAPAAGSTACAAHDSDYNPQDWVISLSELLRVIQFYNSGAYHPCPGQGTEDGFCPGA